VLASYPSAATVPRDVVFGRYSNIGDARESWTAPCYVLNVVFADDVLPLDEDPMPFDGNPHSLLGNLIQNNNMFFMPHYLELGWNVDPNQQPEPEPEVHFEEEVRDNMQEPVEEMVVDSIILNPSNASVAQQLVGGEVNKNVHLD
jgi:hypothetical protein